MRDDIPDDSVDRIKYYEKVINGIKQEMVVILDCEHEGGGIFYRDNGSHYDFVDLDEEHGMQRAHLNGTHTTGAMYELWEMKGLDDEAEVKKLFRVSTRADGEIEVRFDWWVAGYSYDELPDGQREDLEKYFSFSYEDDDNAEFFGHTDMCNVLFEIRLASDDAIKPDWLIPITEFPVTRKGVEYMVSAFEESD